MNFGLTSNPQPALSWKTFVLRYRSKAFVNWIVFRWLLDHVHLNLSWNGIAMLFWRTSAFLLVNMRPLVKTNLLNDHLSRTFACLLFILRNAAWSFPFCIAVSYGLSLTMERHRVVCYCDEWYSSCKFGCPPFNEKSSRIEILMHFGGLFYYLYFHMFKRG